MTPPPRPASLDELLDAAVAALPGGVRRPGQRTMAHAVEAALAGGGHLLVQAGTGTGKSLAYLLPALRSDSTVVVATATLALQSQLVDVDLPRLLDAVADLLPRRPEVALLKGRGNYLCRLRLADTGATGPGAADPLDLEPEPIEPAETAGPAAPTSADGGRLRRLGQHGRLGEQVRRLRRWADSTDSGDRADLDPGVSDQVWWLVSVSARDCVGASTCMYGQQCFAEAARARAREADLVVTNHRLLALDLVTGGRVLPEHDAVVVDEAHELVAEVTATFAEDLTVTAAERAARRAGPQLDAAIAQRLDDAVTGLRRALDDLPPGRLRTLPGPLATALSALATAAAAASGALGRGGRELGERDLVARQQARTWLDGVTGTAARLGRSAESDVAWLEADDRGRRTLRVAPLQVSDRLGAELFAARTVVATSATLTVGGDFAVLAEALGLPPTGDRTRSRPGPVGDGSAAKAKSVVGAPPAAQDEGTGNDDGTARDDGPGSDDEALRWRGLDVGSPFDYARQGILYVARRLPPPGPAGIGAATLEELTALVTAAGGRTLGLFSSMRAAVRAAEATRDRTGLPVLLQGDAGLGALVRRFRADTRTCLFGTLSLWQGVDVPGPACQLVVIDRLPFPRPDEPLPAARVDAANRVGRNGFRVVSAATAAVLLAQGAGRLIRSASDRGVVAVLDSRMATRSYGEFMRASLPPFWYTTDGSVVRAALARLDAAAPPPKPVERAGRTRPRAIPSGR